MCRALVEVVSFISEDGGRDERRRFEERLRDGGGKIKLKYELRFSGKIQGVYILQVRVGDRTEKWRSICKGTEVIWVGTEEHMDRNKNGGEQ